MDSILRNMQKKFKKYAKKYANMQKSISPPSTGPGGRGFRVIPAGALGPATRTAVPPRPSCLPSHETQTSHGSISFPDSECQCDGTVANFRVCRVTVPVTVTLRPCQESHWQPPRPWPGPLTSQVQVGQCCVGGDVGACGVGSGVRCRRVRSRRVRCRRGRCRRGR